MRVSAVLRKLGRIEERQKRDTEQAKTLGPRHENIT